MDQFSTSGQEFISPIRPDLVKNTETQEIFDSKKIPFQLNDTLSLDGIYEHYKSTEENPKYYRVSGVVENIETDECFVIYESLYVTYEKHPHARPLKMFTEEVEVDGQLVPRFRFVTDDVEFFGIAFRPE